jgi:hypothetical protein
VLRVSRLARIVERTSTNVRMLFGYEPNVEWLRARLSRAVAFDRARAVAAIAETERCLRLRMRGGRCARFADLT